MAEFIRSSGMNPVLTNSTYSYTAKVTAWPQGHADGAGRDVSGLLKYAERGNRLSAEQAISLHDAAVFYELGRVAHRLRSRKVGGDMCEFIIDRNISFTNVCVAGCRF